MPARSPGFIACIGLAVALLITRADVSLAATPVPLGTATSFAVLGGTPGVTNTGLTVVTGDLGVSPAASVTGFPPGIVVGTIHAANAVAASAQFDSAAAYGLLAAQACDVTFAVPTDLAGMTLAPGVYCFASSASNTGLLNLDAGGNTNAVWLFRTASTLITGSGSAVVPINGGQACNVYWQVGSSATLGTGTRFVGSILALTSISVMTGSTLSGRALAQTGAVTLDTSNVSVCSLAPIPPLVMPALAKSFMPNIINAGGLSTLTVTLSNPNPGVATLTTPLVDTLPSGVVIAPLPNGTTTCGGGTTVTATAGGSTVSLPTGRTIPANGSCTISVSVTAPLAGTFLNVLPVNALQTSNGNNPAPANATLTVVAALPSLAKSFMPNIINAGGLSTLTVTLSNLNPTVATLTTPLVDTLPSGVVIAPLPNGTTTCGGGTTVTATAGGSTVSLPTGRTIPANGSCTITVSVTAPLVGTFLNVLPVNALQTSNGNNPAPANATLTVVAALPSLAKSFMPTSINAGGLSTLTVTLSNLNPTVATLTTPLVDTLPSGVVIAPLPNGTTTCGGGTTVTATAGGSTVSLPTGRTIPANGSCTISVSVTAPLVGTYVNVLPVNALQTSNGNNPEPAFATLIVVAALPPVATPAVPTLSEWMIVILAALMVVVGGIATRRSSR